MSQQSPTPSPPPSSYPQPPYPQAQFPPPYAQPPKQRSSLRTVAIIIAIVVGLGVLAIFGVGFLTLLGQKVSTPQTITASDGQSQVTVPGMWKSMSDLNESAEIQVGLGIQEQYLVVLTEAKADFSDIDLETYADWVLEGMGQGVELRQISDPQSLTIHGLPAIQYELRGTVDNINIVYWLTAVEGTTNYYQVVGWTLASRAERNRAEILEVINSFQEIVQ